MNQPNPLITAWYIDPYTETIQLVETTDSLTDLARWLGTHEIGFYARQENGDAVIIGADAAKKEYIIGKTEALVERVPRPPAWQFLDTNHIFYGRALWVNSTPEYGLQSPYCTKRWLEARIDFWGFTHVVEIEEVESDSDDVISHLPDDEDYFTDYMNQSGEDSEDNE